MSPVDTMTLPLVNGRVEMGPAKFENLPYIRSTVCAHLTEDFPCRARPDEAEPKDVLLACRSCWCGSVCPVDRSLRGSVYLHGADNIGGGRALREDDSGSVNPIVRRRNVCEVGCHVA